MKFSTRSLAVVCALTAVVATLGAQERDRSTIPDKYKWNLADIYPSDAAWRGAKDALAAELPTLGKFKGRLMSSPATLADALDTLSSKSKEFRRLNTYAGLLSDEDTRDSAHLGMKQEMQQLSARLGSESSFINPEILKAGKAQIDKFVAAEPRLAP